VNVTLGTNLVTATGGAASNGQTTNDQAGGGGGGGVGRIRIETGSQTSVTTNPSASLTAATPRGASWYANEDTRYTGAVTGTIYRLRTMISNEGADPSAAINYRLEVSGPGQSATSCSVATYTRVDTDTNWDVVASTFVTDNDPTANITTVSGTQELTDENTTFVAGRIEETADQLGSTITLANTNFTEIEYVLQATSTAETGATYCFRLTNAGSTTDFTYTVYPRIQLQQQNADLMRHGKWFDEGDVQAFTF
jgi:hypothetical protein